MNEAEDWAVIVRAKNQEIQKWQQQALELSNLVAPLRDEVARLTKLKEAFAKTTKGNITINRYEHGGGRMFVEDGKNRDLIADTYNEGDREFIALCYEVFAALTPQAVKGG